MNCTFCVEKNNVCAEHKAFDHNGSAYGPVGHYDPPQSVEWNVYTLFIVQLCALLCIQLLVIMTVEHILQCRSMNNVHWSFHPNGCTHGNTKWYSGVIQSIAIVVSLIHNCSPKSISQLLWYNNNMYAIILKHTWFIGERILHKTSKARRFWILQIFYLPDTELWNVIVFTQNKSSNQFLPPTKARVYI